MGALFRMPFIYVEDMLTVADALRKENIALLAAHLSGDKNYYSENLKRPIALMIGNEGNGLSKALTDKADVLVKIPMEGQLESLNAAVSAAIILYEAYRQRAEI
jgi:TrmH family RNA methyltransferase